MLIFAMICLAFSLLTVVNFIFSGFHSKNHRLLPMVMVVISLYYFYVLVDELTGAGQTIVLLKDLLIAQVFSILFYYIAELMEMKINPTLYILVSALDILLVLVICLQVRDRAEYRELVLFFLAFVTILMVIFVLISLVRKSFTRKQKNTYILLFIALLVPLVALTVSLLGIVADKYIMLPALLFTEFIFNYLIRSDLMVDAKGLLKDELFDSAGVASLLFDDDLYFLDASNSARELFPRMIEGFEKNPKNYYKQDVLREWTSHYTDPLELEIEDRYYNGIFQKVFLKNKPWGYVLIFNDITAQKKETNKALKDANNKSMYLAKMSHELRSPLHAIIGGSEIVLGKNEASPRTLFMVNQIRHAGEKLLTIVNSILEYSKMENGVLTFAHRPYSFYDLISDQACAALVNLQGKDVDFVLQAHTPVDINLCGDELRIREIIQNIISNAIKFTEHGSIKCDVYMEEKNGKCFITIRVSDTGLGMSKEQLSMAFTEFVSYANEKSIEGTGLGLAICKELCSMLDGDISAESDGKSGTTITASFYQDYADLNEDGSRDASKVKNPFVIDKTLGSVSTIIDYNKVVPTFKYPKARVLVVDDMEVNHVIFGEMTKPWDFIIDRAYSGLEAVEFFKENEYDLIFLDQMMPVMSGVETIDAIRKINPKGKMIPIIMLTADISDKMKHESIEHGFNAYIEKPIAMQQLKDVIEKNMPVRLRRPYFVADSNVFNNTSQISDSVKESYLKECQSILEELPDILNNDIDLFRIKVHGLKSVSRQLGQNSMADFSEVMEMAAKCGHTDFIKRHIRNYMEDVLAVVEKVKQEMV